MFSCGNLNSLVRFCLFSRCVFFQSFPELTTRFCLHVKGTREWQSHYSKTNRQREFRIHGASCYILLWPDFEISTYIFCLIFFMFTWFYFHLFPFGSTIHQAENRKSREFQPFRVDVVVKLTRNDFLGLSRLSIVLKSIILLFFTNWTTTNMTNLTRKPLTYT